MAHTPSERAGSPCPSPSPSVYHNSAIPRPSHSPSPVSPSPAVPWHFPFGPSSRFTHRERTRPAHTRHQSTYTPQAPVLSTEQRAHRRAQSYGAKSPFGIPNPTPPASECGRSPLGRFPSLPGQSSRKMASGSNHNAPVTPAKASMNRRRSSMLQDSPFSDYFTDDARSLDSQTTPTSETQHLLVRLNKLQSQLMRGENAPEMLNIVGRRIGEIEGEVEALHSRSRTPAEMDEDLFTEVERNVVFSSRPNSKRSRQRQLSNPLGIDGEEEYLEEEDEEVDDESEEGLFWGKPRQDKLLAEAQTALRSLTEAQEQLRQRHRELVQLNEELSLDMEEKEMEVERLRSENESLRSDLGFDHSELLFLELQLKSLEVECEDVAYTPKLERLQRQMENWRDDWRDVEARFKKRRGRYGVIGQGEKSTANGPDVPENEDDPKCWSVEVNKQGTKRVNSLTIRRVSKEAKEEEARLEATPTKPTPSSERDHTPRPQKAQVPSSPSSYTSQATQTSPPPSPTLTPVSLAESLGLDGSFDPDVDDCAITTSPSSHAGEDSGDEEEEDDDEESAAAAKHSKAAAKNEQRRTALRELWSGLTNWAGMDDDDDDDDDGW